MSNINLNEQIDEKLVSEIENDFSKVVDVVVVGGGIAGLTSAIYLAREGMSVIVYEQSSSIGGRARTSVIDGFYLNQGPHALYLGGAGAKILKEIGVHYAGNPPPSPAFLVKEDKMYPQIGSLYSILSTKLLKGFKSKINAIRFFGSLGKIDFENIQHIALERWLGENIQSKDLAELIKTFCRIATYSTDSKVMSAGAALRQLHMAASSGVLYLNGGWQNLVEGLAIAAKKAKVSVVANKKVISIQEKKIRTISFPSKSSSHRMWDIILSDGKNIVASKVVLAVSPYAIKDLLNVSEPTKIQNINNEGIYPVRSACLDVLLKQLPNPNKPVAFGIDKPLYLSTHSLSANLVDKKGKGEIIHVMKYLSVYEKSNPKKDRLELEHFLNTVQPDWRKVLIKERFSPNMIVSNSIVAAEQGGLKGRLPTKAEGLEGLYIVGDWIGNEGLLADASFASAKQASMEILKEKTQRVQSIGQLINN